MDGWILSIQSFFSQNSSGPITEAQLTGLRPHRSYQISVSTFNRAGNGDQYSGPVTFTTNQTGEPSFYLIGCLIRLSVIVDPSSSSSFRRGWESLLYWGYLGLCTPGVGAPGAAQWRNLTILGPVQWPGAGAESPWAPGYHWWSTA